MKKNIFVLVLLCRFSVVYAAGTDCESAVQTKGLAYTYSSLLPASDFEIARSHLLAFCCKAKYIKDASACTDLASIYPESPFWYDHLIDVGFRRLDVIGAYDVNSVDPDAKEWQDFITQKDDPTKAITPLAIQQKYEVKWSIKYLLKDRFPNWTPTQQLQGYEKALSDTTGVPVNLSDKYINRCYAAMLFYQTSLAPDATKRPVNIEADGFYSRCLGLAQQRIVDEYKVAQILMIQKTTRTLADVFHAYASNEFVQNRLMKLADKIAKIVQYFTIIRDQAPLCAKCSK